MRVAKREDVARQLLEIEPFAAGNAIKNAPERRGRNKKGTLYTGFSLAPAMRSDIIVEDFMPIRIRHPDKNSGSPQQVNRPMVMVAATSVSRAYYPALVVLFGLLYGSI